MTRNEAITAFETKTKIATEASNDAFAFGLITGVDEINATVRWDSGNVDEVPIENLRHKRRTQDRAW